MKKYFWKTDRWNGGQSDDSRIGPRGAFRYGYGLDIHQDTGKLLLARKPVRHSGTDITKTIKWIELRPSNGDTYCYGEDTIYKESAGVYTVARTLTGDTPNGQGLCEFNGFLLYRSSTWLGKYDYTTFTDNFQTGLEACPDFSPIARFKNFALVGHGRYVATLDDVGTWTAQRLKLPPGYTVRDFDRVGTYIAIVAIRGSQLSDSDEGMLFMWDGTSQTYNDFIPLDGNPHFVKAINNTIYVLVGGPEPILQKSLGGPASPIMFLPDVGIGKTAEVYPGAKDIWRGRLHFGVSAGTSETVLRAVHSYGSKRDELTKALVAEFPPSSGGMLGSGVQVTAVKRIGTTLRYAVKSGADHWIDQIDTTKFQTVGVYRSLAHDRESPYKKLVNRGKVEFAKAIIADQSVQIDISPDPYDDQTFSNTNTLVSGTSNTVGDKALELPVINSGKDLSSVDIHFQLTLRGNGNNSPEVKRTWVEYDEAADQL